jgi:NAD(P)-dependent dehydrogenase (short-subunit alcohol dehydrogenase family)
VSTIAIVGAGPNLGLSMARRFARDGMSVALIARNGAALDAHVATLQADGIDAARWVANVMHDEQLTAAMQDVLARFGGVDVLGYSPLPDIPGATATLDTTRESALQQFQFNVLGALACLREVLPGMLERGGGGLLFTLGRSAAFPVPFIANVGIAMSGLRSYVHDLHDELAPRGIYAGTVIISARVEKGGAADPDAIAELYHDMYIQRDRVEEFVP